MEKITFQVEGSAKKPYEVVFIKDGDSLTAICDCPAGTYGNFCKHRISILDGDSSSICSENIAQAAIITGWLSGTDVETALAEVRAKEAADDVDKDALNEAKRKLARAMNT